MRIGIIGAGQLGQMLGEAAQDLGHQCHFLDPADKPPAASAGKVLRAAFDDVGALAQLAAQSDVITYEFENVAVDALRKLATTLPVYPPPEALRVAQDRLSEKQLFERLDIPLPRYQPVNSLADLSRAATRLNYPFILKTRRFGYDGKGQFVVHGASDNQIAWDALGGHPLIAEELIAFDFEVSIIGVRSPKGAIASWPLTRNEHVDGILRRSRAPESAPDITTKAECYMQSMLRALDYVGVLALELFVEGERLLANEFAPRVHNSGHWTIEGSTTSQFHNHILAITGKEPQAADCPGFAGMLNLIGSMPEEMGEIRDPRVALHDYGKQARAGRKLGHITVTARSAEERDELLAELEKTVTQSTLPPGPST
ncbi:MAG TPA: 5-(carboxyamino)imidazole ribonucleotide synthase [Woeseiaceae bacterium]|nr:5-(carboxyamino)imidazole ribonucleotide synthase [Woeseiaceae bacterium]